MRSPSAGITLGAARRQDMLGDLILYLLAQLKQHVRDVDLDGADLAACAAQTRSKRQIGSPLSPNQLRRQHSADRTRIDPAISMAADLLVDRAGIQASSAPDAVQGFTQVSIGKRLGPAIVKNHDVQLLRSLLVGPLFYPG